MIEKKLMKQLLFYIKTEFGEEELKNFIGLWRDRGYQKFYDMPRKDQKILFIDYCSAMFDAKKAKKNPCDVLTDMIPF